MTSPDDVSVPDGMPVLKADPQPDPRDGACVMQYISALHGERFSTLPSAVNDAIARWCWEINDTCRTDDLRADLLMPLVPRLMRTHRLPSERRMWIAARHEAARAQAWARRGEVGLVAPGPTSRSRPWPRPCRSAAGRWRAPRWRRCCS
jgi:hypothetical protein